MDEGSPLLPYKKILAAYDGSAESTEALRRALRLARDLGAEVTAFSVDEHLPRYARGFGKVEQLEGLKKAYFAELRAQALALASEERGAIKTEAIVGHAAESIVGYAQDFGFDLIVIGHSKYSRVWGTLFGSTTAGVVDHARCDVLVVR